MILYLGVHRPTWLTLDGPPLMVSLNTLPKAKGYRAVVPWFLDSGGFTEIQKYGKWRTSETEHADRCRDVMDRFGMVAHVSPQDWMCEPPMIHGGHGFVGTGLSIAAHQECTVSNYLALVAIDPGVPWVPVLQGWDVDDYHRCVDLYASAGVDLTDQPLVGVGSVCRREAMDVARDIMETLASRGLALHGFGFKQEGNQ